MVAGGAKDWLRQRLHIMFQPPDQRQVEVEIRGINMLEKIYNYKNPEVNPPLENKNLCLGPTLMSCNATF